MARILRVIESLNPAKGGPAYSVRESSSILSAHGHEVTVLTLDDPSNPPIDPASLNFSYIPIGQGFGKFSLSIQYFLWLVKNRGQFDLAVVHGIWQWPSLAYRLARGASDKFITMPHGSLDVWDRGEKQTKFMLKKCYWKIVERPLYKASLAAFFTAEEELMAARRQFDMSGIHACVVPYGAVSAGVPRLEPMISDRITYGYLGRIHPKKGIELLLDAFAMLVVRFPNAKLRIAGSGEKAYIDTLLCKCKKLNIEDKVEWVGNVYGEAKRDMLASIGLFVLPSFQENFGLAVAESLSVGTPVLISPYVNVHPHISSHSAGFVADRTVDDFYSAMLGWSSRSNEFSEWRKNAVSCFEETMSLHRHVEYIEKILYDVSG